MFLMFGLVCILPCVFVGPCVLLRFVGVPPSAGSGMENRSFPRSLPFFIRFETEANKGIKLGVLLDRQVHVYLLARYRANVE